MKPAGKAVLKKNEWYVADVPFIQGTLLVEAYHYARGGSNTAVYMHGLYRADNNVCYGVAWWLPPTRRACESVNKNEWKKVLSLSRLVIAPEVPQNACSFLLSRSIKIIRKDKRFVSLVTYADDAMLHTGAIYRASNWQYVGKTAPTPKWLDPKNGRQVACKSTVSRTKAEMIAKGYVFCGRYRKHKFILHL